MPAHVEIFTTRFCPYCIAAKRLLQGKGVEFVETDAPHGSKARAEAISRSGGRTTVPQIFIAGHAVGGSDDLHELDRLGRLDALLAGS